MTVNLSSSANLIRPNVQSDVTDLVFREADLLAWFERRNAVKPNDGGAPYLWNILSSTTAATETFVEGQGLPVSGSPAYVQASVPAVYQRAVVSNSGHVRDQVIQRGVYADPVQTAIDDAIKQLRILIDATLAGSAANKGIASIVDAADLYAGIDPAVVTSWASLETAVGGALTIAVLNTMYKAMTDSPRGAYPTDILCNSTQAMAYGNIFGGASTVARSFPIQDRAMPYDPGGMDLRQHFSGVPLTTVRSIAASELYMLDTTDGFELREQRKLSVEPLAKDNDDDKLMVSRAWIPVVRNRRKQGKLTGLSV